LLRALGLSDGDFAQLAELSVGGAIDEICAGRIDAAILVLGHPNSGVGRALSSCGAVLVPVVAPRIDAALADGADYSRTIIPRSAYPGLATDIPTYAVTATLVTRASADPANVKTVVGHVLNQLKELGKRAPVLTNLNVAEMRRQGLTAPLHPGAKAAFDQFDLEQGQAPAPKGPHREDSPLGATDPPAVRQ
jgi:TRAP transporter TAXI family solute receptor